MLKISNRDLSTLIQSGEVNRAPIESCCSRLLLSLSKDTYFVRLVDESMEAKTGQAVARSVVI
jgi:hypothetical protein